MKIMLKRLNRKGEGALSLLFTLVVIIIVGAIVWQVVGTFYQRYEIGLALDRAANQLEVSMSDEEIRVIAVKEFNKLKLPEIHDVNNIVISRKYDKANLTYRYVVEVGIPFTPVVYPWELVVEK